MSRFNKLIIIISVVLICGFVWFYQSNLPSSPKSEQIALTQNVNEKSKSDSASETEENKTPLHYNVIYKVGVKELNQDGINKPLMEMQINLDFAISTIANNEGRYTGIAYNISSNTNTSEELQAQGMPKIVGFTFDYNKGVFSSVDTLGLSDNHPIALVKILLPQLTFSKTIQELSLSDTKNKYNYFSENKSKGRELISFIEKENLSYSISNLKENWELTVDNNQYPKTMFLVEEKSSASNSSQYQTLSNVNITRKQAVKNFTWDEQLFLSSVNNKYNQEGRVALPVIKNKKELMQALANFNKQGSRELATAIGNFIINNLGSTFVFDTILDIDFNDQQKSVLIYALQEATIEGGEDILNSLSVSEDIDEQNRLRAIISSAYRGERATNASLAMMSSLLDNQNINIANTALLNLGNLGKLSTSMQEDVNLLISEQLDNYNDKYVVMRAVDNMGSIEHNDKFVQYLNSGSDDLKKASASLLAKSEAHRPQVIEQMFKDKSIIGTKSMVEAIIKSGNTQLTNSEDAKMKRAIVISLKQDNFKYEQLLKLYFHNSAELNNKDKSFLKSLSKDYNLSQSIQDRINEI